MIPVTWTPGSRPGLRRGTYTVPAYDRGWEGGQHCEEWHYIVGDGVYALSLEVSAGNFPRGPSRLPRGDLLCMHVPQSTNEDAIRENRTPTTCSLVDSGKCFGGYVSTIQAEELFALRGLPQAMQEESFWFALETKLLDLRAQHEAQIAKAPHRCPTCSGTGLVPKGSVALAPEEVRRVEEVLGSVMKWVDTVVQDGDEAASYSPKHDLYVDWEQARAALALLRKVTL